VSRKIFVLDNKLSITDDEIWGILERTVTKQRTSAKADVLRRYLGKGGVRNNHKVRRVSRK
jgi:putative transposon-encoded protein